MPDLSGACRTKRTWPLRFTQEELRQRLTPMQYHVTQERGTERYKLVFQNKPLRFIMLKRWPGRCNHRSYSGSRTSTRSVFETKSWNCQLIVAASWQIIAYIIYGDVLLLDLSYYQIKSISLLFSYMNRTGISFIYTVPTTVASVRWKVRTEVHHS